MGSHFRADSGTGDGSDVRSRLQALANEIIDLRPDARIAFTLHVVAHESAIEPACAFTLNRSLLIIEAEISENLRLGIICSLDLGAPVDKSMWLVEVDRCGDVIGNHFVALPGFCNAIHLNGEQNGDAFLIEFAG